MPLLLAGGALWLFLAAIPALADGGPHVSAINSGTSTLTAGSCAGCHRAHTAQGEFLLKADSEQALCLSCHGSGATLATTDVEFGLQYEPAGNGTRNTSVPILGALRNGGFLRARIDSLHPTRLTYQRGWSDPPFNTVPAISPRARVGVLSAGLVVNSAHVDLTPGAGDGIADNHLAWGKGTSGTGVTYTVTCVDCHNPHGNNQYRILKPVPGLETDPIAATVPVAIANTYANFDTIVTSSQHGLAVGDAVVIASTSDGTLNGSKIVVSVVNGFTFKVGTFATSGTSPVIQDLTADGTGGTVVKATKVVTDSAVDPDSNGSNPTKNYTVIAVKGYQGNASTFLLYARDVVAARTAGYVDFVANNINAVPSPLPSSGWNARVFTTLAHGFGVGDTVTISGTSYTPDINGVRVIATVPGSTSFTISGITITATGTTGGTITKRAWGSFGNTSGDYFHRTVPWNPALLGSGLIATTSACNPLLSAGTDNAANASACNTMQDAPNGLPATITSGDLAGQIAFNDQISTWCSSCHTRYYSNTNARSGGIEPSSRLVSPVLTFAAATATSPANRIQGQVVGSTAYTIPAYGDTVTFSGMVDSALNSGSWYVIATGGTGSTAWFQVTDVLNGMNGATQAVSTSVVVAQTVTRTVQSSAPAWWYPRADGTFKYQHQTTTNRACVTCHVGHGSNAAMTGPNSLSVFYPDGSTTSTSSRLLKIDNRGTCQMCHDPTGTVPAGTVAGPAPTAYP